MPPSPGKPAVEGGDPSIAMLCALIASATEFNPDYNIVAQHLGLKQGKNV